ncbi:MAG: YihY/virulence factor BrkB family protein [Acidobacteria bacterium]|nr:YihY/virulence factor BrkB family protein [Acidobacteriota bacterium]
MKALLAKLGEKFLAFHKGQTQGFSRPEFWVARVAQMVWIVWRSFRQDLLRTQAAALTYSTLISMVPLLVMGLALLRGLGYGETIMNWVNTQVATLPPDFQTVAQVALDTANQADFAKLGGIGGVILLVLVIQVISRVEHSFNSVWGVRNPRRLVQKFSHYISIMVVVPILLVAATTITAQMKLTQSVFESLGILKLIPFFSVWLAMAFLNLYLPNTKVLPLPAIVSGFFSAVLWLGWFRFYMTVQPGVARYNILYGTLASVPIFLVWLYFSWLLVLIGAKFTYAWQNTGPGMLEEGNVDIAPRTFYLCCRAILKRTESLFQEGKGELVSISDFGEWPIGVVHASTQFLIDHDYLHRIDDGEASGFVLAHPWREQDAQPLAQLIWHSGLNPDAHSAARIPESALVWDQEFSRLVPTQTRAEDQVASST